LAVCADIAGITETVGRKDGGAKLYSDPNELYSMGDRKSYRFGTK